MVTMYSVNDVMYEYLKKKNVEEPKKNTFKNRLGHSYSFMEPGELDNILKEAGFKIEKSEIISFEEKHDDPPTPPSPARDGGRDRKEYLNVIYYSLLMACLPSDYHALPTLLCRISSRLPLKGSGYLLSWQLL